MRLALIVAQIALLALGVTASSAQSKSIFDDSPDAPHPAPAPVAPPSPSTRPPGPTLNPEPAKPPIVPPSLPPAIPPIPPETPPAAPTVKLTPPDATVRAKTLLTVKKVYETSYAQSTTSGRHELELEMLSESAKILKNFAAKYVLLQEALRLALATQDVDGCRKAIADLDNSFVVNRVALTTESLKKLSESGADDAALVTWAIDAVDVALEKDDYPGAHRILTSVSSSHGRDAALRARLKAKSDLLAEAERLRPSLEKLKSIPDDPAANFMVGRFLCFLKHDWDKGLVYLGRGTDAKLAAVARADMASPTDAKLRFALAGQWWDLGDDKAHLHIQGALHERAAYWYQKAAPELADLDKAMAEKRMATAVVVSSGPSNNILMQMIPTSTNKPTQSGTDLVVEKGKLRAPFEVSVPFRADVVAKTDSVNLRLGFCEADLVFNWHENKDVLFQTDPKVGQGRMSKFNGKGEIPPNQFVTITWIVQDDGSHIYVDGKERAAVAGDYKGLRGPFYVFPRDSVITVRSVSIAPAPPTGGR